MSAPFAKEGDRKEERSEHARQRRAFRLRLRYLDHQGFEPEHLGEREEFLPAALAEPPSWTR